VGRARSRWRRQSSAVAKDHNTSIPILDAIEILSRHGMGVVSGIILDLNTNTHETPARIGDFVRRFSISMPTINLRQALPLTSLRAETYSPEELYGRFTGNAERTDPNRIRPPASARRASRSNLRKAARSLSRLLLHAGLLADY
jgi:hopanoid C-2 methylase